MEFKKDTQTSFRLILFIFCLFFFIGMFAGLPSVSGEEVAYSTNLTNNEKAWLKAHPVIKLAPDPEFKPIEFFDQNGFYTGIAADYTKLLEQKLGIKFTVIQCANWDDVTQRIKNREVDILNAVVKTPQRETYLRFPSQYLEIPSVIIARKNVNTDLTLDMLKGMKVVMVSGYGYGDLIRNRYPELDIEFVPELKTALRKVSFGMVDAFVGDLATASFYIESEGITNLKIVGETEPPNISGFAVRSDWPELSDILEKGIALFTEDEKKAIFNKWIHLSVEPGVTMREFKRYAVISICIVTFLVFSFLFWNRQLKRVVNHRTEDLRKEIEERRRTEKALEESKRNLRTLIDTLPDLIWSKDSNGVYLFCNKRFEDFFGAQEQNIIGKTDYDFVDKNLADFFRKNDNQAILKGGPTTNEESIPFASDGHYEILETIKTPLYKPSGELAGILGVGRDITQRTKAEDTLRSERDYFNQIMETSPTGILRVDNSGQIVYANKRAEQILGIQLSESTTMVYDDSIWKITDFYGNPLPIENLPFNLVKKTHRPIFDVRYAIVQPNGRTVFLSINASPLLCPSGNFNGIVSSIDDISDKYRAEQNYKMLFREMLDGFALHEILCDDSGNPINYRFLEVNPAFERLTGLKAKSLIGKTVLEVLPQTERYWIERYGKIALTGEPDTFENYSKELNRYFHITAFRYARSQFACIFVDVTERKMAEAERNQLVEAINQAAEIIVITDLTGSIQYANPVFEKITGYSISDIIGKNPRFLKSGIHDTRFYKKLWDTILSGRRWAGQLVNRRKNGALYTSECSISPVKNEEGQISSFVWIAKDISDQKEFEKRINQAQKMESIGSLAGGIAHDFNNILFPILGLSELLMDDFTPGSMEHENIQGIYTAGKRGSELVQQILAFSRKTEIKMIPVRIQQILKEVLKLIRSTIPANIEIERNIQQDCGLVMADPTQIHQVAMNLITNAYHAVEEVGGKIWVQLQEIHFADGDKLDASLKKGRYVMLSVSDNGCAIDPKIISKIFEPYFTTKPQGKGTGLGLSVVYGIVKEYKGDIRVKSVVDEGTTFKVYLPIMEKYAMSKSSEPPKILETGTERILIVDDEIFIAKLEKQMLERLGYTVTFQTSSIDALNLFIANPNGFDLLLTDMSMPGMTGIDMAKEIVKLRPDLPVILCTGFSEQIGEELMKQAGIKKLLNKPVLKYDMAKTIRNVLNDLKEAEQPF
ncbi:MAG: PAS domain S-box protein [Desulfobacterium sp.]|nr:PAS domain S-box protein [Desulfobacterium sp.]